jgi:hypothetical protein
MPASPANARVRRRPGWDAADLALDQEGHDRRDRLLQPLLAASEHRGHLQPQALGYAEQSGLPVLDSSTFDGKGPSGG